MPSGGPCGAEVRPAGGGSVFKKNTTRAHPRVGQEDVHPSRPRAVDLNSVIGALDGPSSTAIAVLEGPTSVALRLCLGVRPECVIEGRQMTYRRLCSGCVFPKNQPQQSPLRKVVDHHGTAEKS